MMICLWTGNSSDDVFYAAQTLGSLLAKLINNRYEDIADDQVSAVEIIVVVVTLQTRSICTYVTLVAYSLCSIVIACLYVYACMICVI